MVDKLEPCPFCGGEAKRFTIGDNEPNNAGGDVIVCTRCQASSHVEFGRKENLVSSWNRRPTSTEDARERVKVLEEALRSIAEGNLGDASWQANYDRIREVAAEAFNHKGQKHDR